jgi:hypothetical protein
VLALEKIGFHLEDPVEAECVALQNLIKFNSASLSFVNNRGRIHCAYSAFDRQKFTRAHEISLVNNDNVREGDLFLRLLGGSELADEMFGVDHSHDRIELRASAYVFVDKERMRHRRGIRKAGRFDENAVERPLFVSSALR